ncbi:MAG: hypothetical protein ABIJ52_04415 [Pseudomonadota bacterium]|nr:hypothetical protein [Pseudomonadota bacterium]MBU1570057.1 hypothetical protein [Pseudomonadota bacterium]
MKRSAAADYRVSVSMRKQAILGKFKEIRGLCGGIRNVCRTRNSAD